MRVKSIEYLEVDAIAVYFYDVTHHVESIKPEGKKVSDDNKSNSQIDNSQSILAHKVRTPLTNSLMLIEGILHLNMSREAG